MILSPDAVEAMHLSEGAQVELLPISGPGIPPPEHRYATRERALKAFEDTLPLHENTYRELAK